MRKENKSISKISKEINRSRGVVTTFLKDFIAYGKNKCTGRPRALSLRARESVLRLAKGKNITTKK
jgi:transposase